VERKVFSEFYENITTFLHSTKLATILERQSSTALLMVCFQVVGYAFRL